MIFFIGANPNIASREGILPQDCAISKNMPVLQKIIQSFSSLKGIQLSEDNSFSSECRIFSDVDNILLGLDCSNLIQKFKDHKIGIQEFLVLNEADLIEIGVEQVCTYVGINFLMAIIHLHIKFLFLA